MPSIRSESDRIDATQMSDLFGALEDEDCRALLQAAAGDARSASELSEECDLPLSTTYRKVDKLADVGLLAERLRLCSSGKHTSEYALNIADMHISLTEDGIGVQLSERTDRENCPTEAFAGAD